MTKGRRPLDPRQPFLKKGLDPKNFYENARQILAGLIYV